MNVTQQLADALRRLLAAFPGEYEEAPEHITAAREALAAYDKKRSLAVGDRVRVLLSQYPTCCPAGMETEVIHATKDAVWLAGKKPPLFHLTAKGWCFASPETELERIV